MISLLDKCLNIIKEYRVQGISLPTGTGVLWYGSVSGIRVMRETIGEEDSSEVGTADKTRTVKTRTCRNIRPQTTGRINWNGGKEDSS